MDFFKLFFTHFCIENFFAFSTYFFNFPFTLEMYHNYDLFKFTSNIFINCFFSYMLYIIFSIFDRLKNGTYRGIQFDENDESEDESEDDKSEEDETEDDKSEEDETEEIEETDSEEDKTYDNNEMSDDISNEETSEYSLSRSCMIEKELPIKLSIYLDLIKIIRDHTLFDCSKRDSRVFGSGLPSIRNISRIYEDVLNEHENIIKKNANENEYLINNREKIMNETLLRLNMFHINML